MHNITIWPNNYECSSTLVGEATRLGHYDIYNNYYYYDDDYIQYTGHGFILSHYGR
jgi:hypothetical protein